MRIFIFVSIVLMNSLSIFSQTFNVQPKGYLGGLPGGEYSDVQGYVDPMGGEHAIIGSASAINIINMSNCAQPFVEFQYIDGSTTGWREFDTYQGFAYAVCDVSCNEGLEIINLSNFTVTQDISQFTKGHTLQIDQENGRLYVSGSNSAGGTSLIIYTLDTEVVGGITYSGTPANPVFLKKHPTTYIHDLFVRNNIVYASHGNDGYRIWNVANPNAITQLANFPDAGGYNHSSFVTADGYSYSCEELPRGQPMKIYKITGTGGSTTINLDGTFTDPCEAPTFTNARPHNPYMKGDTLFVSYYEDGVVMWDISERLNPKRIAYYDTYTAQNGLGYNLSAHDWKGSWAVYPYLPSGCHLVSDITQGLFSFKMDMPISDGANLGNISKINNSDVVFSATGKGIVLRNPEGYCYRLKVSNTGVLSTEQIICNVKTALESKLYKADIAFDNVTKGVVLKSPNGTCYRTKIDDAGVITTTSVTCSTTSNNTVVSNGDIIIETNTKGIILKGPNNCYRITLSPTGTLVTTLLNTCP